MSRNSECRGANKGREIERGRKGQGSLKKLGVEEVLTRKNAIEGERGEKGQEKWNG